MQLYSFEGSHRTLDEINAIKKSREEKVEKVVEEKVEEEVKVKKVKKSKKK